jgi:uncharacterized protein (UPF0333 family)
MSTGQTLLTLAAIVLLSIIVLQIGAMHVEAVNTTVETQETNDAINIAEDVIETLQSYTYNYDEIMEEYGGLDDVSDENKRLQITSEIGEVYYITVELSSEETIQHGQTGRRATVQIYEESETGDDYDMLAELRTAILPL